MRTFANKFDTPPRYATMEHSLYVDWQTTPHKHINQS